MLLAGALATVVSRPTQVPSQKTTRRLGGREDAMVVVRAGGSRKEE